jgi:hypothetical protein
MAEKCDKNLREFSKKMIETFQIFLLIFTLIFSTYVNKFYT